MRNYRTWLGLLVIPFVMFLASCGGSSGGGDQGVVIVNSDPAAGAVGVDYFKAITVYFDQELNETTINADNVKLTRANGTIDVPGAVTYDLAGMSITFTPTFPMVAGAPYVLNVANAVFVNPSLSKQAVGAAPSLNFTTQIRPIIYISNADLDDPTNASAQNIWAMYEDGTGKMNYTTSRDIYINYGGFFGHSAAPGYRNIAYVYTFNDLVDFYQDLWIMNGDGTGQLKITNGAAGATSGSQLTDYVWAPDGSKLYFAWRNADETVVNIYMALPDGTVTKLINFAPDTDNISVDQLSLSPDGTLLLFRQTNSTTNFADLFIMELNSPTCSTQCPISLIQTVDTSTHSIPHFQYSHDGTKVYFSRYELGGSGELYYVLLAGPTVVGSPVQVTTLGTGFYANLFALSPDGTKLFYEAVNSSTFLSSLFVANGDGTSPAPITSMPGEVNNLMWFPDSSKVAYAYGDVGNLTDLYMANVDGTGVTNLTNFTPRTDVQRALISSAGDKIIVVYENLDTFVWTFSYFATDGSGETTLFSNTDIANNIVDWWQGLPKSLTP